MTARRSWTAGYGILLLAAFLTLGAFVDQTPLPWDFEVRDTLLGEYQDTAGSVAEVLSAILGPVLPAVLGASLLVGAVVRWRAGDRRSVSVLVRIAVVLGLCRVTSVVFKPLFDRERPRIYPDLSYPSGHVVSVASFAVGAALLSAWFAPRFLRRVVTVAVVATVLAAACRVVLQVHWLTDTVGAVLAVTGVALLAGTALRLLPAGRHRETAGTASA